MTRNGRRSRSRTRRPDEPGPPGRREAQKRARERRILGAAESLFARRGFEGTTMGAIARRARVAVGTLYNYFPSKAHLVLALLHQEGADTLAAAEALRKRPPRDPGRAVLALLEVYVDLVGRHDRRLLRELLAAALAEREPIGRAAFELDLRLMAELGELLGDLRGRGQLAEDVDPTRLATTLYAVYATWLTLYAADPAMSLARLRDEVRGGARLVLRGLVVSPEVSA